MGGIEEELVIVTYKQQLTFELMLIEEDADIWDKRGKSKCKYPYGGNIVWYI